MLVTPKWRPCLRNPSSPCPLPSEALLLLLPGKQVVTLLWWHSGKIWEGSSNRNAEIRPHPFQLHSVLIGNRCKFSIYLLSEVGGTIISLPGDSVRDPARGKGHEEGGLAYAKAGSGLRGPPGLSQASNPKTRVCLPYRIMLFAYISDINRGYPRPPFSGENQLRALANKCPGHERNISNQTPSVSILACLAGISRLLQLGLFTASQLWEAQKA